MSDHDWEMLKQDIKPEKRKATWLTSFTDMITLVLAFFVLIFSMKEMKQGQSTRVQAPLSGEVGKTFTREGYSGPDNQTGMEKIQAPQSQKLFALNYLEALFKMLLEKDPILSKTTYHRLGDKLVLSLDFQSLMEQQGQAGEISLGMLVNTLGRVENRIEILAYIKDPEDWRRSIDLSQSVAKILKNSGYNRDILISVYGGSQNQSFYQSSVEGYQPGTINLLISE